MLGLSDYARRFVRAFEKEKTDREHVVTRCETTFDAAVISADAIQPAIDDRSRAARWESEIRQRHTT
jgi:hypothetical protein